MRTKRARSEDENNSPIQFPRKDPEHQGSTDISRLSYGSSEVTGHDLATLLSQKPLRDPSSQIRLLRMSEESGEKQDSLQFAVIVQDLKEPVDFIAISYTWGEAGDQKHIFIDGKKCSVRRNCHEALLQTVEKRRDARCDLIWIDSICINQQDTVEKSYQVSIMGDIYARATGVFACVGPHSDHSEFLFEKAREVANFGLCTHAEPMCPDCRLPWERWTLALGILSLDRLCQACHTFGGRSYWSRVWIIQEIAKAGTLSILCGTDLLPWTVLNNLEEFLGLDMEEISSITDKYKSLPCCEANAMHDVFRTRMGTIQLDSVFSLYSESGCSDPRDHLYGLLSIIEWPKHMGPIFPDYGRPAFDLALQVQAHIPFELIPEMLNTFQVVASDQVVQDLLRQRRDQHFSYEMNIADQEEGEFRPLHGEDKSAICGRIFEGDDGHMTATLVKTGGWSTGVFHSKREQSASSSSVPSAGSSNFENPNDSESSNESDDSEDPREFANRAASFLWSISTAASPKMLMLDAQAAGFVCNETLTGDVLVPVQSETEEIFLVLRPMDGEIFEIIGQAIIFPGYVLGHHADVRDEEEDWNLFTAYVEIKMSANDTVLLFAQDMDGTKESFHEESRWRRVLTRATATHLGRARLSTQSQMRAGDVARPSDDVDQITPEALITFVTNMRENVAEESGN